MHLDWKRKDGGWVTRSFDGAEARIYPHPGGEKDLFVVEAVLGGDTYRRGVNATKPIDRSPAPARTRQQIIDALKLSAESCIIHFEILGIRDEIAADAAIRRMDAREWHRRISGWWAKNLAGRRSEAAATISSAPSTTGVTEPRAVALRFHIDTNRINSRGKLPAMNRLERWRDRKVIEILMPEPAADEAMRGGDQIRNRKAQSYVHGLTELRTADERRLLLKIERIIFPKGLRDDRDRRDVEIVFNAQKYGGYLVTNDGASKTQPGGILGAAEDLADLGVQVITDADACRLVEEKVRERDERGRREANELGVAIPDWVGLDD